MTIRRRFLLLFALVIGAPGGAQRWRAGDGPRAGPNTPPPHGRRPDARAGGLSPASGSEEVRALSGSDGAGRTARCSICRHIGQVEFADYIRDPDAAVAPQVGRLVAVKTLGYFYPELMRCPECGTYYLYSVDCGYMEHDVRWERISDRRARELLRPAPEAAPAKRKRPGNGAGGP